MKTVVVSYSLTGNNEALADAAAKALPADHIKITEAKNRKAGDILLDMIFGRTPSVQPAPAVLDSYEQILFLAPVWMGKAASPLRAYLKYLKKHPKKYAFASISGGALNDNPKLADDLIKRVGTKPAVLVDQHIADLLPAAPKPTTKDTSAYRLNDIDKTKLSGILLNLVKEKMGQ